MALPYPFNIATSLTATALRAGAGVSARIDGKQPEKLLELYDFEACPHCRLVREVLTELDIDALIKPCPKGGQRYRQEIKERGGKAQFPYLVDPNTGTELYESTAIIRYLFETYGSGSVPWHWQIVEVQRFSSVLASVPRWGEGLRAYPANPPELPLELYSFESSPFARPVRDLLCEMEIAYILRSVGRTQASDWVPPAVRKQGTGDSSPKSRNRIALQERAGIISIPYLVDPNTGEEMAESAAILDYLKRTYAA